MGCYLFLYLLYCVKAIWFPTSLKGLLVKLPSAAEYEGHNETNEFPHGSFRKCLDFVATATVS